MKIQKSSFGNLKIYDNEDNLLHIIPTNLVISLNSRPNLITFGEDVTDTHGITIDYTTVTEIDGVAFSGTREQLAEAIEGLLQNVVVLFDDYISVRSDDTYEMFVDKNVMTGNTLIVKTVDNGGTTEKTFYLTTIENSTDLGNAWTSRATQTYLEYIDL